MKSLQDQLSLTERLNAPTPKLFRLIRNGGIILASIAGALMGAQSQGVELPAFLTSFANLAYVLAGAVATLISQLTVDVEKTKQKLALD